MTVVLNAANLAVFIVHREGGTKFRPPFNPLDFRGRPNTKFVQRFQKWIRSPFPQNRGKLIWHGRHLKSVQIWTDSRSGEQRGRKFAPPLDGADLRSPQNWGEAPIKILRFFVVVLLHFDSLPAQLPGQQRVQIIDSNVDIRAPGGCTFPDGHGTLLPVRGAADHHEGAAAYFHHLLFQFFD